MEYILTTNNLSKKYGNKYAADKINIHVKRGEIYGLIGRNGAGKTTILKMISGLANPTDGEYSINGKNGSELAAERPKVGALIETPGLYPNLSAYENIKLKCIAMGMNDKEYIIKLLRLVGLENTERKKARNFSLGMKQRLGIALALVGNPDIIVLDEPINGLDPQGIVEVREILGKLSKEKGVTIIISSHILDELSKISNSYGIIHEGRLIEEMTSKQLEEKCGEYVFLKTNESARAGQILQSMGLNNFNFIDEATIRINHKVEDTAEIVERLVTSGIRVSEISVNYLSLEEYYLYLTGGLKNV